MTKLIVRQETVEIDGREYPRCVRAVGLSRCAAPVTNPNTNQCGAHERGER